MSMRRLGRTGIEAGLDDDVLAPIAAIVPPGIDISPLDVSYAPHPLPALRRRPANERAAA
ncbi:hypothetical protein ACFQ6S_06655 [Streptomyces sp. NPDC056479]|uniref:hypothetical protein n=1 Tax=Streptomyces sp. NPDC056479 TaxID=3345832 RepID=UPI0036B6204D